MLLYILLFDRDSKFSSKVSYEWVKEYVMILNKC